jgi:hypothetical protein
MPSKTGSAASGSFMFRGRHAGRALAPRWRGMSIEMIRAVHER